jgi:hypothetical protein
VFNGTKENRNRHVHHTDLQTASLSSQHTATMSYQIASPPRSSSPDDKDTHHVSPQAQFSHFDMDDPTLDFTHPYDKPSSTPSRIITLRHAVPCMANSCSTRRKPFLSHFSCSCTNSRSLWVCRSGGACGYWFLLPPTQGCSESLDSSQMSACHAST